MTDVFRCTTEELHLVALKGRRHIIQFMYLFVKMVPYPRDTPGISAQRQPCPSLPNSLGCSYTRTAGV